MPILIPAICRELLDRPPIGANMAFRKEMFEKYGGFREDLGPRLAVELAK